MCELCCFPVILKCVCVLRRFLSSHVCVLCCFPVILKCLCLCVLRRLLSSHVCVICCFPVILKCVCYVVSVLKCACTSFPVLTFVRVHCVVSCPQMALGAMKRSVRKRAEFDFSQVRKRAEFDFSQVRKRAAFDFSQVRKCAAFDFLQLRKCAAFDFLQLCKCAAFDFSQVRKRAAFNFSQVRKRAASDFSQVRTSICFTGIHVFTGTQLLLRQCSVCVRAFACVCESVYVCIWNWQGKGGIRRVYGEKWWSSTNEVSRAQRVLTKVNCRSLFGL